MALQFFQSLLQHSDSSGSRSTVLKSLTWFLAILFAVLGGAVSLKIDKYIIVFIMILIGVITCLFLFAYVYCLFTDKDALRSESYSIQKMRIEKGIYGDNSFGILSSSEPIQNVELSNQESGEERKA